MDRTEAKILTKKCTKCGAVKPLGEGGDFAKNGKLAGGSIMWQSWCKTCKNQYNAKYFAEPENREARRQRKVKYRGDNPQVDGLSYAVKRSTLSEAKLLDGATRQEVWAETKFDYILRRLITEKTGVEHHIDHIVPISKGGIHRLSNIRIIPASLNQSKSAKFDEEWYTHTDEDEEERTRETLEFSASLKKTLIHA